MKTMLLFAVLLVLPFHAAADDDDNTLKGFLEKSDLVIVGRIVSEPMGIIDELGVVNYICKLKVSEVLKGGKPKAKEVSVNIVRFESSPEDRLPYLHKGAKCILFLKKVAWQTIPAWRTANVWFGIWRYTPVMARSLKRVAREMAEEVRWRPLKEARKLDGEAAVKRLIGLVRGPDKEVAMKALSQLSRYSAKPSVVKLLKKLMASPDPHLALKAASITCYGGDWSGFKMLLAYTRHPDPGLRLKAIAQLGDVRFQQYAQRVEPLLLERLRVEADPALMERAIESLENYPSKRVLRILLPYLNNENEQVRGRADLVVGVLCQKLNLSREGRALRAGVSR